MQAYAIFWRSESGSVRAGGGATHVRFFITFSHNECVNTLLI